MINAVNVKSGKVHVTSDDVRNLNAAIIGNENYVSSLNKALTATMINANTLRINEGCGFFNGCFFRVEGYEDANITTGTAGYKRIDVVALKYTSANNVEKIELVTLTGTKTTGTPVAPWPADASILNGTSVVHMSLYTISLNGINIDNVTPVFKKYKDISSIVIAFNNEISSMQDRINALEAKQMKTTTINVPTMTVPAQGTFSIQALEVSDGSRIRGVNIYTGGGNHTLIYSGFSSNASGGHNIHIRNVGTGTYVSNTSHRVYVSYN